MSLKPCTFKLTGVKGELSYDQMRKHLLENPDLWEGKKIAKVSPAKIVVNKFSKSVADKFDKLSKAMGFDTKIQFIGEDEARNLLNTDIDNLKLMLVGQNARLSQQIRDNLSVAMSMQYRGADPDTIWQATGWEQMPDKKWRYEIPTDSLFTAYEDKRKELGDGFTTYVGNKIKDLLRDGTNIKELFPNGSFIANYPSLGNMPVLVEYGGGQGLAYYDYLNKRIVVSNEMLKGFPVDIKYLEEVLLHEMQHAIQHKEGFAPGGSTLSKDKYVSKTINDIKQKLYDLKPEIRELLMDLEQAEFRLKEAKDQWNNNRGMGVWKMREAGEEVDNIRNKLKSIPEYVQMEKDVSDFEYKIGGIRPYDFYQSLLGEVEARNVSENRFLMTEAERKLFRPSRTAGIHPDMIHVFYERDWQRRGYSYGREEGFKATRTGTPIGYTYDTEQTARERFDFSNLTKIGSGSDRDVYDLGNGKVLKVAKNGRGLEQNIYEGDNYLINAGILPDVYERGLNYVVVQNVPKINYSDNVATYDIETGEEMGEAKASDMLRELSVFTQKDFDNKVSRLQDVFRKYGLEAALDYDIVYGDFTAKRNWGYINGKPVHVDGGTFGGIDAVIKHRDKALNDADFKKIYDESKRLKKQFQDTDKNTRYLRTPEGYVMGFVQKQDDGSYKVYIDPKVVNPETPIHEIAGHIFMPLLKETNPELYAKGVDLIKDSPYMDKVRREYPELSEEEMYEEALAQAIGEKGVSLLEDKRKGFVSWLKTFWQKTADAFGIKVSPEKLSEMTLDEFTDLIAGSVLNADALLKIKEQAVVEEGQTTAATEDPVGTLLTGATEDQKQAAFDQIVEQAAETETEGRTEYEQERSQDKSFGEAIKEDVRAFLLKGADAISKYSDKAKAFITNISRKTKMIIGAGIISGGLLGGATNYISAVNEGHIPTIGDIVAYGERAMVLLGITSVPQEAGEVDTKKLLQQKPEKVVIRPDTGKPTTTPVVFNIRGKVVDYDQKQYKLWMYQRDADNGHLVYVPGPHKRNFKAYGAPGVSKVEGVGHFLVSTYDLTHLTTDPVLKQLKEGFLAEIRQTNPNGWVPTFKKENNNLVRLTFKKLNDVTDSDIVVAQLHQTPFLDIDFDARMDATQYVTSSVTVLRKKSTGEKLEQYLMCPSPDNFNRCSGGSFFIMAETPSGLKIREMSGPINLMVADAYDFAKKNGVGMDKITIGIFDAASYSAKPVADKNKVVKLEQYEKYNTRMTISLQGGASLMIPEGGGVEFRKAIELSENEENTPDNIAAIVNVMNTLPGADVVRNVYEISQQKGTLDVSKSKRKGIVKDVPTVSIEDFLGRPLLFTISDELTTGEVTNPYTGQKINNLKGGLYFNYSEGNTGYAWAFTDKKSADKLLAQAKALYKKHPEKYPDKIVPVAVVKMGKDAMSSNEAIIRQIEQNVKTFPADNKKMALSVLPADIEKIKSTYQKRIDKANKKGKTPTVADVNAVRGLNRALELAKTVKSFDAFVMAIKTLPINARPLIIERITRGKAGIPQKKVTKAAEKKPVLKALMEGLNNQDVLKLHIGNLVQNITEPSLANVPDRHIMSFVGVDVTANNSVMIDTHPNYPAALAGKGLGVLENTVHLASASPAAYAATIAKMTAANLAKKISTVNEFFSRAFTAGLPNKFFRGESLVSDLSDFDKLVGALRLAFPSVQFFTDEDSWADIMDNPDVKKYVKNGEVVYGLTKDGNIYLNPDIKDFNTPIHEAGHIWVDMLEQTNNDLLQRGFQLIEGTKELKDAIAELGDNIQARKEALAVLIGNKGESIVNAAQKSNFTKWLDAVFEYVQNTFKSLQKTPKNKLANITLNQFVEGAIADILGGKEVAGKVVATSEAQFAAEGVYSSVEATAKALDGVDRIKLLKQSGLIDKSERTSYKKYNVGDVIDGNQLDELSGDEVTSQSNKKFVLIQTPLSNFSENREQLLKEYQGYEEEESYRLEKMKENFTKTPPIPMDGDGLHRIVSAKELGHKTILMWHEASSKSISIAYHAAKKDGSNPELVAAVENVLGEAQFASDSSKENKITITEKGENISFESRIDFETDGGILEIGKRPTASRYSILNLKVDESKRRQGIATRLLKVALDKTQGQLSGMASHDASVEMNYKLGMRAFDESGAELSLAETKEKRAKNAGESILMMLPENKRGDNYVRFDTQSSEPQFRKSLPTKVRNAIQDLINEQRANPKNIYFYEVLAKARGLMQAAGLSEAEIDAQVKALEEREEAKTESEYFTDYVNKLKAAAKLTIPESRALMRQFRNFLNSEEDLDAAISFVDRLVKKKDLFRILTETKDAYKKLKKLRYNSRLTIAQQKFVADLALPRFYLLDEATLIKLREMAKDFVDSSIHQTKPKYTLAEIDAAYNEAAKVLPITQRKAGTRKIAAMTRAEMEIRTKLSLAEYSNEIPAAKELAGMDLSLLDKNSLALINNALRIYDETGMVFSLPAMVETVRALNDARKIQKSGIIAKIEKLAAGGIAARLQSVAANADEIRKILVGGWDRNAGRVTIETQELRKQIDEAFAKLKMSDLDKFTLGAYAFFKEDSKGQTPEIKANALAAQMNNLKAQIDKAKEMNSDAQEVAMLQHYYTGNTEALKSLGVIVMKDGKWQAAQDFNVDALVPDNVKAAWDYSQKLLSAKTAAYTKAMAEYHGKDFEQIFQYFPRAFYKTDVTKADLQAASEELPPMGSIDPQITRQSTEIAARNEGRTNVLPKVGGFYILDGYENLVNGMWDISATIELSKAYAYTNALINKANITSNTNTNADIKKYIVSSVKGILRDPMIFPDNRSGRDKAASALFNIVTTTILNNFTQLFKQTMATTAGVVTNPTASMQAMGLIMQSLTDKRVAEALDKFYKNTSEPYTLALSYIELDTLGRNKGPVMEKVTNAFEKIKPEYLVGANRFTQRVLLLSGYLANINPDKFVEDASKGVFNENALAAAENNAEMANSTANRHFLPLQLKDAGTMKKFLYFLGTYNFVTTSLFWNNAKILQGAGYTKTQKDMATKQMASLLVQQVFFQLATRAIGEGLKAIGRDLDWLDEESEEERRRRWSKYWYQIPAGVAMDLTVGPMVGILGDALKTAVIAASEAVYKIAKDDKSVDTLDILFKRSSEYPGVYGVIAPLAEQIIKASQSKDDTYKLTIAVQAAAMMVSWGDVYYLSRIKASTLQSVLKLAGGDEVLKQLRDTDSEAYKSWINSIRERNIPDKFIYRMSWQNDGVGYYVPTNEMQKFVQVYNREYIKELSDLTKENNRKVPSRRKSAEQIKKNAENAATLEAQSQIEKPRTFKMPKK